jgi:hypothetical protein
LLDAEEIAAIVETLADVDAGVVDTNVKSTAESRSRHREYIGVRRG